MAQEPINVLYVRGDAYVVESNGLYYFLTPTEPEVPALVSEYVSSFLKFGYFEDAPTNALSSKDLKVVAQLVEKAKAQHFQEQQLT